MLSLERAESTQDSISLPYSRPGGISILRPTDTMSVMSNQPHLSPPIPQTPEDAIRAVCLLKHSQGGVLMSSLSSEVLQEGQILQEFLSLQAGCREGWSYAANRCEPGSSSLDNILLTVTISSGSFSPQARPPALLRTLRCLQAQAHLSPQSMLHGYLGTCLTLQLPRGADPVNLPFHLPPASWHVLLIPGSRVCLLPSRSLLTTTERPDRTGTSETGQFMKSPALQQLVRGEVMGIDGVPADREQLKLPPFLGDSLGSLPRTDQGRKASLVMVLENMSGNPVLVYGPWVKVKTWPTTIQTCLQQRHRDIQGC
ncbi:hypothetical protein Bbelb_348820 [Branchiostoma belcheri]|nr:hypothetical protein Bbelb_348820 [Branchiostoma belcheri]